MSKSILLFEVCRVYELGDIAWSGDGEHFRFRIEILRSVGTAPSVYHARIYRHEHFRIQPTFPQQRGRPKLPHYDKLVLVADEFLIEEVASNAESSRGCLEKVLGRIEDQFGVDIDIQEILRDER